VTNTLNPDERLTLEQVRDKIRSVVDDLDKLIAGDGDE
jgi:hypothetical protein